MVDLQWTRRDAIVWAETRRLLGAWTLWQRFLWWLIAWTPFEVRVIMSRDGLRPYLLRATLWPRPAHVVAAWAKRWALALCVRGWYVLSEIVEAWGYGLARWATWLPPVFLHYGFRADEEQELHNHPWAAVSLILSEGYLEERWQESIVPPRAGWGWRSKRARFAGTVVFLRRGTYHRILTGHWFSLFVPFKRTKLPEPEAWRFWSPESGESWPWREYVERKRGQNASGK